MKAYRIVDWQKQYEVTNKGHVAKAGTQAENIRTANLSYVRIVVHGHSLSAGYRRMVRKAWVLGSTMEMACFGLFIKLLEMAADQERQFRGFILDERQRPINAAQIADLLDIRDSKVQELLEILCDDEVGWVELVEFPISLQSNIVEITNGNLDKLPAQPGIPGTAGLLQNETKTKQNEELNETKRPGTAGNSRQIREPIAGGEDMPRDPPARPPAQPSVSVSGSAPVSTSDSERLPVSVSAPDSDSASASAAGPGAGPGDECPKPLSEQERFEIARACQKTTLELTQIIHPRNSSDITTINDIFAQLQKRLASGCREPLLEMCITTAKQCYRADKPIAMFIAAMKKPPFCYVPKRLSVIPRNRSP